MIELKPGVTVQIKQEDGEILTLFVDKDGVRIKAERPWTNLEVRRDSSFFVSAKAVKK